jgi:hypothetical protein
VFGLLLLTDDLCVTLALDWAMPDAGALLLDQLFLILDSVKTGRD